MSEITFEFATKDDCLDKMVPSDLRRLVAQRDALQAELAELREGMAALQMKWLNSFCRPPKPTPEAIAWDTCIADVAALLQ